MIVHCEDIVKSDICPLTLMKDDTLDEETQRPPRSIIFIDTESTFQANCVHQIAEQKNLDPEDILKRIYHCNVYSSEELEVLVDNL